MNKPDLSSDELSDEDIWSNIESYFETVTNKLAVNA